MPKVTEKQATFVLNAVAEWLGKKGLGTPICPEGRPLDKYAQHDDGTPCSDCSLGPAPTGPDAAYRGEGPELKMYWDWAEAPTVLLEGGPYEWAITCCGYVQSALDAKGLKVYVEPYAGYALSIYPN